MATTRSLSFSEMPGAAPDIMRDYDLATLGYEETEYSFEGTATSYELQGERGADGRWDGDPGCRGSVPDPVRGAPALGPGAVQRRRSWWSGTTSRPASTPLRTGASSTGTIAAQGHAWVGVSAQKVGIDGGGFVEGIHLKLLAPERYADLEHPGDAWSFDIFTQVGAVAAPAGRREPAGRAWSPSRCSRRASPSRPPAW